MIDEKRWWVGQIPGTGDVAFWAEEADIGAGMERIEVENLTRVLYDGRGGAGLARVASPVTINMMLFAWILPAPDEIKSGLAKLWNTAGIVLPTNSERKRILE